MHSIELIGTDGKERKHTLPSSWNECSAAQLASIAALTSVGLPKDTDEETRQRAEALLRLRLFHELTGISDEEYDAIEVTDLLQVERDDIGAERVALLPWVSWCLQEPVFDKSLVHELSVAGERFIGPRDRLARWTVRQWVFADQLLARLGQTGEMKDLNNLMAALYRPADRKWSNKAIERNAARLAAIDDRTKLAAVLNYRGLRTWLARAYPLAFRKSGGVDKHGPNGMVMRLAAGRLADVPKVWSADLHEMLVKVEQSVKDMEESKQKH